MEPCFVHCLDGCYTYIHLQSVDHLETWVFEITMLKGHESKSADQKIV